jgi:hypothetical protein
MSVRLTTYGGTMRIVIEARILEGDEPGVATVLGTVERSSTELSTLGLSLAEGRTLLRHVQEVVVQAQCRELAEHQSRCAHCGQALSRKGMHSSEVQDRVWQDRDRESAISLLFLPR